MPARSFNRRPSIFGARPAATDISPTDIGATGTPPQAQVRAGIGPLPFAANPQRDTTPDERT